MASSAISVPTVLRPEAGNHPSFTEKKSLSRIATKNTGAA
ncbi:Uncharacterised protein [Mycobacteroides abscessus subsp. massiliense]|nr:Uncharacterised protein [Mycobacteroides abscessus subsp. massiliense]